MASVIKVTTANYPESDGKPMGETDDHRDQMYRHIDLLRHFYRGQQVYVSGHLLVYYEQGNPRKFVVPDAFVVKGVAPQKRRIYKIWVEGKSPEVVIETTSRKTRRKDTQDKPPLCCARPRLADPRLTRSQRRRRFSGAPSPLAPG
jgi:Uma2 family endonuclease